MRIQRVFLILIITAIAFAAPRRVHAQDASQQATAQALFDEGMRLFGESQFAESCAKFEASLAIVPAMGTRGKLAECYEKVGRTASAWAAYREVAVLAKRAAQPRREQVASERAARLEALLSYLTVVVSDDARVPGLRIVRNGTLLSPGAYGTEIATDPGPQRVEVSAQGYVSQIVTVEVLDQGHSNLEVPILVASPVQDIVPVESNVSSTNTAMRPASSRRIAGIATVAVGGGALTLATVLGLKARSDYNSAFDDGRCDGNDVCNPSGKKAVDDARSLANIGTAFAVSGTVLLGVGAYLWLWAPDENLSTDGVVRVTPNAGSDSLGLSLSGRF